MIREQFVQRHIGETQGFRWRGEEVSRLEGFSDAVFGFVVTLLVIATEVPKNFNELNAIFSVSSVFSFAFCFVFLVWLWRSHYIFFRRYGLEDRIILILNTIFLFIIVLYVYPLKFLFTWLLNGVKSAAPGTPLTDLAPIYGDQIPRLMAIYGLGIGALYVTMAGFYIRAYQKRHELKLTQLEICDTITSIGGCLIVVFIGTVSIVLSMAGGQNAASFSGMIYLLNLPSMTIYRLWRRGVRHKAEIAVA